ncbi:MAG: hypothetical protein Q7U66_02015 [Methylobacter sp.]|nr:hypothetical protein [Methylobacter sp.]
MFDDAVSKTKIRRILEYCNVGHKQRITNHHRFMFAIFDMNMARWMFTINQKHPEN